MKTVNLSRGVGTLKEHKLWIEQLEGIIEDIQNRVNESDPGDSQQLFNLGTEILSLSQDLAKFKRDTGFTLDETTTKIDRLATKFTGAGSLNSTQITHAAIAVAGLFCGLSLLGFGAYSNATTRINDLEKLNAELVKKTDWQGDAIIQQRSAYPIRSNP